MLASQGLILQSIGTSRAGLESSPFRLLITQGLIWEPVNLSSRNVHEHQLPPSNTRAASSARYHTWKRLAWHV
jgi:hypothetical protein